MLIKNKKGFESLLKEDGVTIVSGEYYNQYSMFTVKDCCGYLYETSLFNYRASKLPNKFSVRNPYTIKNIKKYIELNNFKIKLIDTEYIGIYNSMKFRCGYCNENFDLTINRLTRKNFSGMCRSCSCKQVHNNQKLKDTYNYIKSKGYTIISGNIGSHEKVIVDDLEGYRYKITYNRLDQMKKPLKTYRGNEFNEYNIKRWIVLNDLSETVSLLKTYYKNNSIYCTMRCSCGVIFDTPFIEVKRRTRIRCERCSKHQSNISYATEIWLKSNGLIYKKEYKFDDCKNRNKLSFDYAVLNANDILEYLIEVDGGQHFYPMYSRFKSKEEAKKHLKYIQKNDKIKNEYCKKNNIKLIRLPFWYFYNDKYKKSLSDNINI